MIGLWLALSSGAADLPSCGDRDLDHSVHLMTVGAALQPDRAFGHSAIVIVDPALGGNSPVYDFGNFDDSDYVKVARDVLLADQQYRLIRRGLFETLEHYGDRHQRRVELQELRMTPAQRAQLSENLARAHRDEPVFAYNWYVPNCTTKARDVLDEVLGGVLEPQHQTPTRSGSPGRQVLRQAAPNWPMWFGLYWGVGRLADQPIPRWDAMFLPDALSAGLAVSNVPTASGPQPLVVHHCVAADGAQPPLPEVPPSRDGMLWAIGLALGALLYGLRETRAALAWIAAQGVVVGAFGSAAAVIAWFGTFAPFWTQHNAWFASPVHLGLTVAALVAWRDPSSKLPERIAWGLVAIAVLGVGASLIHGLADRNLGAIGLTLPMALAAAAALQGRRT